MIAATLQSGLAAIPVIAVLMGVFVGVPMLQRLHDIRRGR